MAGDKVCVDVEWLPVYNKFERNRAKYTVFKLSQTGWIDIRAYLPFMYIHRAKLDVTIRS